MNSDAEKVMQFVQAFESKDPVERETARGELAKVGESAVPTLVTALRHQKQQVRWEAAKTLTAIAHPAAASSLVDALGDEDNDVRWVAGEALIALGGDAIVPVLEGIVQLGDVQWRYEGAHHVLHELRTGQLTETLQPVLDALDSAEPQIAAPVEAEKALTKLRGLA